VLAGLVLAFISAVIGFLQLRRQIAEVHVLVNSQLAQVIGRVAQLTAVLEKAGIDIPAEQDPPS
jgi:hypothetical protein